MEMSRPQTEVVVFDPFHYPDGNSARPIARSRRGFGYGLMPFNCEGGYGQYSNCVLVKLYAKMGLHRYNLLKATNFKLDRLKNLNMSVGLPAATYYINLAASLPASGLQQMFQVKVEEECLGIFHLTCHISRPRVTKSLEKELPSLRQHCEPVSMSNFYKGRLPDWPSSNIDFSDTKRFYLHHLAKFDLKIVQVAIETLNDVEPPKLDSKAAVVYIAYNDLAKAKIGEPCDQKAIVRRLLNETTGILNLRGKYWTEKVKALSYEKPSKKKSAMVRRRLGVHRIWRLSNPRWHHAYKKRLNTN